MNIALTIPESNSSITKNLKSPTKQIKNFLSFSTPIPYENHPSARGLKKNIEKEKGNNNFNILIQTKNNFDNKEENNNIKKNSSGFEFTLNYIDEKIYQNEVYYQKNNIPSSKNSCSNLSLNFIPVMKKNNFSQKEKEFDNEITESIKKRESSDIIVNKFTNFANCKL